VGGRVLIQIQDLAMLKTLGFTPAQLVAEHAALGLIEETAGLAISRLAVIIPALHEAAVHDEHRFRGRNRPVVHWLIGGQVDDRSAVAQRSVRPERFEHLLRSS
jgi:hypothetical protein